MYRHRLAFTSAFLIVLASAADLDAIAGRETYLLRQLIEGHE